jgi:tRNA-modifying protein YgfZ
MTTNGITPLPQWGILGLSGPDAKAFLQGQITCNLEEVTLTQNKLGGHCNLKGRLQSLFQVLLVEQQGAPLYLLIMPIENLTQATQQFKKFALFSKVTFTDLTKTMPLIGLCSDNTPWSDLALNHCHTETLSMGQYTVRRLIGKIARFEIICHSPSVFESLWSTLKKTHHEITPNQWDEYDILSGIPTIYPQTADKVLPHHLNLVALGGISFDKGCYLGQEIIARMHYKGKIKKHLYSAFVKSASKPQAGDPILVEEAPESSQPGIVIRTACIKNGYHVLIVLDESDANSQRLKWNDSPVILDGL